MNKYIRYNFIALPTNWLLELTSFSYHLYADDFQFYVLSPNLFPILQAFICNLWLVFSPTVTPSSTFPNLNSLTLLPDLFFFQILPQSAQSPKTKTCHPWLHPMGHQILLLLPFEICPLISNHIVSTTFVWVLISPHLDAKSLGRQESSKDRKRMFLFLLKT